jgi:signal transduction histidine kinase
MIIANLTLDSLCSVIVCLLLVSLLSQEAMKENRHFIWMCMALLIILLSDLFDWWLDGHAEYTVLLYISNTVNYISGYVIVNFFVRYMSEFLQDKKMMKRITALFDGCFYVSSAAVLINLFFGYFFSINAMGFYERGSFYLGSQIYPALSLLILFIIIISSRSLGRKNQAVFILYPLLPLAGIFIDFFVNGLSLTYTGAFLSILCIYFYIHVERGREMAAKEKEMMEDRVKIMLSQIQPHFLYNALSTIQSLCHEDPEAAERATAEFSEFLRGNMDSLSQDKPIAFEKELDHVKHYLAMEMLRFPDKLNAEYHIETSLFRLPTLTLQPIVENAVRYGITKTKRGGTICISTQERPHAYIIKVEDNGAGFDPEASHADGRTHIGIQNVRQRLQEMSQGTLEIQSTLGKGTVAVITIPKGEH